MRPMIKYRGGKSREIVQYERFIPQYYDVYWEPFFGGGATYFYLEPERAVVSDINAPLMNFYREVRNRYGTLSAELAELQRQYEANQDEYLRSKRANPTGRVPNANEGLYYDLRDQFNGLSPARFSAGALYYFINKTAYSGMVRYNAEGHYNVPFGRYANFNTRLITAEHSRLLRRARVLRQDYAEAFRAAGTDDFMYLDPPYDCIFNDYGNLELANGFDENEHRRLAHLFRRLRCRAMMVIGRTPLIEELYGDLIRFEYGKEYAVNIRNRFHSQARHVVITNYEV